MDRFHGWQCMLSVSWEFSWGYLLEGLHGAPYARYRFAVTQVQIYPSLPGFGILQLEPVNNSPLPAGEMLGFS